MVQLSSLAHTKQDCKYHIVWIARYRRKRWYKELRWEPGEGSAARVSEPPRESEIVERSMAVDHVPMLILIPHLDRLRL